MGNYIECIKELIKQGADTNQKNYLDEYPLDCCNITNKAQRVLLEELLLPTERVVPQTPPLRATDGDANEEKRSDPKEEVGRATGAGDAKSDDDDDALAAKLMKIASAAHQGESGGDGAGSARKDRYGSIGGGDEEESEYADDYEQDRDTTANDSTNYSDDDDEMAARLMAIASSAPVVG